MKKFFARLIIFILAGIAGFFGYQFFTSTGIFKPGEIIFGENLSEEEKSFLSSLVPEDVKLKYDINVKSETSLTKLSSEGKYLYKILLPVADFYDVRSDISADSLYSSEGNITLVDFSDLSANKKLLSIDGEYYLDTLESGAIFHYFVLEGEDTSEFSAYLVPKLPEFPTRDDILSLTQTGVTALSRGMNKQLKITNDATAFVDDSLRTFLATKDFVHTSNESSFSEYATDRNICSDSRMIDTLLAINLNIVELTGNHNQDCGDESARATYEKYQELGIKTFGGGRTVEEASIPLELSEKSTNITMIGFNYSTGGMTYDATPGANPYNEEKISADIKAAKAKGNYVIVDIQFNECAAYASEYEDPVCDAADSAAPRDGYTETAFFRHIIDLGADMVVGTSAHQTQTFELYNDGVIYYGLGNLFFDQIWWPGTTRSLVLTSYFMNGKKLQTRLSGTKYGDDMKTRIMNNEELEWFLNRLNSAR